MSYKSYDLAWPDPDEEPRPDPTPATADLMALGLARDEAEQWQDCALPLEARLVLAALGANRDTLTPAVFTNWCLLGGWDTASARAHHWGGFTREEAEFIRALLRHHKLTAPLDTDAASVEDWLMAPLSPAWICRALANGITQVEEAVSLWRRSLSDPNLTLRLDIRADSRGANNRDLRINFYPQSRRRGRTVHPSTPQGRAGSAALADLEAELGLP